jgi:succinate dehydrogenase / fumarate reductase membrane anchor subunit
MSLRSPLGKVIGLGTARDGASHWWSQRVTAVALLVLTVWFASALLRMPDFSYSVVTTWIGKPLNAILMSLLVGTMAWHSQLGVQVVVEDYVTGKGLKIATMLALNFLHVAFAVAGVFAVLRIAFGTAA